MKLKRVIVVSLKIYAVLCTLAVTALLAMWAWVSFLTGTSVEEHEIPIRVEQPIKHDFNIELSYHTPSSGNNRLPLQSPSLFVDTRTNACLELIPEPQWPKK